MKAQVFKFYHGPLPCVAVSSQRMQNNGRNIPAKKKKKQWKKHAGLGIHCKKRKQAAILISSAAFGDPRSKAKLAAMDGLKLGGLQV